MNLIKTSTLLILLLSFFLFVFALEPALAASSWLDKQVGIEDGTVGKAFNQTGDPKDPRAIIVDIIKLFLTFIGLIAVGLVMWGGYTWMTAQGNDEKIKDAKNIITRAVVGLIIILSSYAITDYVSSCVMDITEGTAFDSMCDTRY